MQIDSGQQRVDLIQELLNNPKNFSFIQVIRILAQKIGKDFFKKIVIKPYLSLSFPSNDVINIEQNGDIYTITITFFGLYGASSPLPTFYTEELITERNNEKSIKRDFVDIFNKRIYEFYFNSWLKSKPAIKMAEFNDEKIKILIESFSRDKYIYANILPVSTFVIKELIKKMGYKNIEIEEFVNSYTLIEEHQTTKLSLQNSILGEDTHLGKRVKHCNKFRVVLNEVEKGQFFDFLNNLHEINKMFFTILKTSIEWEYQINFKQKQAFSISQMSLGVNSVVGKTDKIIIKER